MWFQKNEKRWTIPDVDFGDKGEFGLIENTLLTLEKSGNVNEKKMQSLFSKATRISLFEAWEKLDSRTEMALPFLEIAWRTAQKSDSLISFKNEIEEIAYKAISGWEYAHEVTADHQKGWEPEDIHTHDHKINAYNEFLKNIQN
jgi:hypothetical protein